MKFLMMTTKLTIDDERFAQEAVIKPQSGYKRMSTDKIQIKEISPDDRDYMNSIGKLRLDIWKIETKVDAVQFPDGKWLEDLDTQARHWVAILGGEIVGAARLTLHENLQTNPDGYLWIQHNLKVPEPTAHLCKLVVKKEARGMGVGRLLNQTRIDAARTAGAQSIIVTASDKNARLLETMGFTDTGIREIFSNRPEFPFKGLQLIF